MNWFERLFARSRIEQDLAEEIRGHLAERVEELVALGMGRADAARQAAREFGNVASIEQESREVWRWQRLEDFCDDVRFAFRQLRRSRAFATVSALTLAIGIGANTAVFSVVNAVMLRPLPFVEPENLVSVWPQGEAGPAGPYTVSYPNFFDMRDTNTVFEHLVSYRSASMSLSGEGEPVQLRAEIVSSDLMQMLGTQPVLGRGFLAEDEDPGARVVILSHALWSTKLGARPGIVGETVHLGEEPYRVIGVAPPGFNFPVGGPQVHVWTTLAVDSGASTVQPLTEQRGARSLSVMGRLRRGVSIEQATAHMDGIAAELATRYPENQRYQRMFLQPALEETAGGARAPLLLLLGAVGFLLLLACANVANLLLSRMAERGREFALRMAIGAARTRLARQMVAEGLVLASIGSFAGVMVAVAIVRIAVPLAAASLPRIEETTIDARALILALVLMFSTAVLFSAAPAMRLLRGGLNDPLKEGAHANSAGRARLGSVLVAVQIALGLVLLTGAGLVTSTLARLVSDDPGFQPERLLTFGLALPESRYPPASQLQLYDDLLERLATLADVRSAALARPLPRTGSSMRIGFDIDGQVTPPSSRASSDVAIVSPAFFETAGIPLLEGRGFTDRDDAAAEPVLIVNRAFAQRYFPGDTAIGKRIRSGAIADSRGPLWRTIVGIVGNASQSPGAARPEPIYYFPYRQLPWCCPAVVVRAAEAPELLEPSVRAVVSSIDRDLPLFDVRSGGQLAVGAVRSVSFAVLLMASFAGIGLILMSTGLYGVLSYDVLKRTREIGIRIALGARRDTVLALVARRATTAVAAGVIVGVAGSLAVTRLIGGLMPGTEGIGPSLVAAAAVVTLAAAVLAAYFPARRAAAIEPVRALRSD